MRSKTSKADISRKVVPKKTTKKLTQEEYVEKNGCRCPFCGSEDIFGESVEIDAGGATQECTCSDCDKEWMDIYKLDGYAEI